MLLLSAVATAWAGLGPPDVMVVYNAASPTALTVAESYATSRSLRGDQLCAISDVDPLAATITLSEYQDAIAPGLDACLEALPDPLEIDALVLIRGLPYRVDLESGYVSLDAMLQIHGGSYDGAALEGRDQADSGGTFYASLENPAFFGSIPFYTDYEVSNPYAASYYSASRLVRDDWPGSFVRDDDHSDGALELSGSLFVVSRLDGFDFDDALALVERGVDADGALSSAPFMCMAAADSARGARDPECEFVTRMLAEVGVSAQWIDAYDASLSGVEVSAYWSGSSSHAGAIDGVSYAPGAFADNLTSYGAHPNNFYCDESGAVCPENETQTSVARFVRAGATAAHGTVAEPLNNSFPHAGTLLLYAMGYTLGESVIYNQPYVYWQNLLLGDPLTVPHGVRPEVEAPAELIAGQPFDVVASHPDGIDGVRVFVDGALVYEGSADGVTLDLAAGESARLLIEARSAPWLLTTTAWPIEDHVIAPEIRGWVVADYVVEEAADTGDTGSSGSGTDPSCGCGAASSTGPYSTAPWLLLIGLLATRRGARPRGAHRPAGPRPGRAPATSS